MGQAFEHLLSKYWQDLGSVEFSCPSELPLGISVLCLQCGSLRTFVY